MGHPSINCTTDTRASHIPADGRGNPNREYRAQVFRHSGQPTILDGAAFFQNVLPKILSQNDTRRSGNSSIGMNERDTISPGQQAYFQTTHWSAVLTAARPSEPRASAALETLCRNYWLPLYLYVRRKGFSTEDAQDLTQGFFAHLLGTAWLTKADRANGKFRSFLLVSLNNFLANDWDHRNAKKRGGGASHLSIDEELAEKRFHNEPASGETPEHFFDRQWAATVLERAMTRLADEMAASGKKQYFDRLREFMAIRAAPSAYHEIAGELDTTPAALAMAVSRMRKRYREIIRSEVTDTLAEPGDADLEIRHLLEAIA